MGLLPDDESCSPAGCPTSSDWPSAWHRYGIGDSYYGIGDSYEFPSERLKFGNCHQFISSSLFTLHLFNPDIIKQQVVAVMGPFAEEHDMDHFRFRAGGEVERIFPGDLSG